jgi:RNA polymerase sigma-70 factor (ECF subfamily)
VTCRLRLGTCDAPAPRQARPGIPETEAELVARATDGDAGAFEQLAGAHADRVFAVLLWLLGDRGEAADVAREVMLRAWRSIGRFQGRSLVFSWLYRIAINQANRSLEKSSRRAKSVSNEAKALQPAAAAKDEPSRQVEHAELRDALSRAMADLPPAYRTAIVLRDVEGLSAQQAAEIAGVGQAAFKSRLRQAHQRLRAAIGDEALTGSGW